MEFLFARWKFECGAKVEFDQFDAIRVYQKLELKDGQLTLKYEFAEAHRIRM
jgi:hypothetical protein